MAGDVVTADPVGVRQPAQASTAARLWALALSLCCAAVLGLAAWMTPSPSGLGTHQQALGLPPCGWIVAADLPCPTCGMTTAFAHAADGRLWRSFRAQPMGALLAVATAMTLLVGMHVAVLGSRLHVGIGRLWGWRTAWGLAAAVLAAWGYKILAHKGWM